MDLQKRRKLRAEETGTHNQSLRLGLVFDISC